MRTVGGAAERAKSTFPLQNPTVGAVSSVGRAPARQAGGHWFEPSTAHSLVVRTTTDSPANGHVLLFRSLGAKQVDANRVEPGAAGGSRAELRMACAGGAAYN